MKEKILGGILGTVVGDARGNDDGLWSDDSSMSLLTAEALIANDDTKGLMDRFVDWIQNGTMTPNGEAIGIGRTTKEAIVRYAGGSPDSEWGGRSEQDNGNGSLMRILPIGISLHDEIPAIAVEKAFDVSALTHAHVRAQVCCGFHTLLVQELLEGAPLPGATAAASAGVISYVYPEEKEILERILTGTILSADRESIRSTGYVVDTLEASLWAIANHDDFKMAVDAAIALGGDTDTIGSITGGLAGVIHGVDSIPNEWIDALPKSAEIRDIADRFAEAVLEED